MNEVLYRFFDADQNLLYVGISNSWGQRLKQHYKNSDFFEQVATITLERFQTRTEVEAAEKLAIIQEKPKYNKAFNPYHEDGPTHIKKIANWVYGNIEPDEAHQNLVSVLRELWRIDDLWIKKSNGPLGYYLQEFLPYWTDTLSHSCEYCVNIWHCQQIASWSEEFRSKVNAAY